MIRAHAIHTSRNKNKVVQTDNKLSKRNFHNRNISYAQYYAIDFGTWTTKVGTYNAENGLDLVLSDGGEPSFNSTVLFKGITVPHLKLFSRLETTDWALKKLTNDYGLDIQLVDGVYSIKIDDQYYPATEITNLFFKDIKKHIDSFNTKNYNSDDIKIVMTVPKVFSEKERQYIFDAASSSGMDVVQLLEEPIAALYSAPVIPYNGNYLYVDNSTTLRVSLINLTSGTINYVSSQEFKDIQDFPYLLTEKLYSRAGLKYEGKSPLFTFTKLMKLFLKNSNEISVELKDDKSVTITKEWIIKLMDSFWTDNRISYLKNVEEMIDNVDISGIVLTGGGGFIDLMFYKELEELTHCKVTLSLGSSENRVVYGASKMSSPSESLPIKLDHFDTLGYLKKKFEFVNFQNYVHHFSVFKNSGLVKPTTGLYEGLTESVLFPRVQPKITEYVEDILNKPLPCVSFAKLMNPITETWESYIRMDTDSVMTPIVDLPIIEGHLILDVYLSKAQDIRAKLSTITAWDDLEALILELNLDFSLVEKLKGEVDIDFIKELIKDDFKGQRIHHVVNTIEWINDNMVSLDDFKISIRTQSGIQLIQNMEERRESHELVQILDDIYNEKYNITQCLSHCFNQYPDKLHNLETRERRVIYLRDLPPSIEELTEAHSMITEYSLKKNIFVTFGVMDGSPYPKFEAQAMINNIRGANIFDFNGMSHAETFNHKNGIDYGYNLFLRTLVPKYFNVSVQPVIDNYVITNSYGIKVSTTLDELTNNKRETTYFSGTETSEIHPGTIRVVDQQYTHDAMDYEITDFNHPVEPQEDIQDDQYPVYHRSNKMYKVPFSVQKQSENMTRSNTEQKIKQLEKDSSLLQKQKKASISTKRISTAFWNKLIMNSFSNFIEEFLNLKLSIRTVQYKIIQNVEMELKRLETRRLFQNYLFQYNDEESLDNEIRRDTILYDKIVQFQKEMLTIRSKRLNGQYLSETDIEKLQQSLSNHDLGKDSQKLQAIYSDIFKNLTKEEVEVSNKYYYDPSMYPIGKSWEEMSETYEHSVLKKVENSLLEMGEQLVETVQEVEDISDEKILETDEPEPNEETEKVEPEQNEATEKVEDDIQNQDNIEAEEETDNNEGVEGVDEEYNQDEEDDELDYSLIDENIVQDQLDFNLSPEDMKYMESEFKKTFDPTPVQIQEMMTDIETYLPTPIKHAPINYRTDRYLLTNLVKPIRTLKDKIKEKNERMIIDVINDMRNLIISSTHTSFQDMSDPSALLIESAVFETMMKGLFRIRDYWSNVVITESFQDETIIEEKEVLEIGTEPNQRYDRLCHWSDDNISNSLLRLERIQEPISKIVSSSTSTGDDLNKTIRDGRSRMRLYVTYENRREKIESYSYQLRLHDERLHTFFEEPGIKQQIFLLNFGTLIKNIFHKRWATHFNLPELFKSLEPLNKSQLLQFINMYKLQENMPDQKIELNPDEKDIVQKFVKTWEYEFSAELAGIKKSINDDGQHYTDFIHILQYLEFLNELCNVEKPSHSYKDLLSEGMEKYEKLFNDFASTPKMARPIHILTAQELRDREKNLKKLEREAKRKAKLEKLAKMNQSM